MRTMIKAFVIAAGLAGFGAAAQAAPVSSAQPLGVSDSAIVHVQMMSPRERMMRRRMMRQRMMMRQDRRMMRRDRMMRRM